MIRIAPLEPYAEPYLKALAKSLYTAFGVGTEVVPDIVVPESSSKPYNAHALLEGLPTIEGFSDDRVLFLTHEPLAARQLISGATPTFGVAQYHGRLCVVTTGHLGEETDDVRAVSRYAMQELGHTFGLHHCLEPRCAMYPQWTPGYAAREASFCTYCRDKCDKRILQLKS